MALFILNPGTQPLGNFDILDGDNTVIGGELMCLGAVLRDNSTDISAKDSQDGYLAYTEQVHHVGSSTAYRPVAQIADDAACTAAYTTNAGNTSGTTAVYLADDGTAFYGVTLGTVIGSTVGHVTGKGASTATNLGPSSLTGSGKVTLWDKAGLYAISLTALNAYFTPTSSGYEYDTPLPGEVLFRDTAGLVCRYEHRSSSPSVNTVGTFVELCNNGSLVTTPARLIGATEVFDRVKIQFFGAIGR